VHSQRHLRLAAITAEVALADQEAQEEADREIAAIGEGGLGGVVRSGGCCDDHERNFRAPAVSPSS
jgi:hypothetical protein